MVNRLEADFIPRSNTWLLIKKLHLKPEHKIAILNAPAGYNKLLGKLPDEVSIAKRAIGDCEFVHLFVASCSELNKFLPRAVKFLKHDGLFWISYPKKSSGIITDISRDHGWEPLTKLDFRPVAAISINETWSALRFRPLDASKR